LRVLFLRRVERVPVGHQQALAVAAVAAADMAVAVVAVVADMAAVAAADIWEEVARVRVRDWAVAARQPVRATPP
jgi:hypothetical protein